MWVFWEQQGWLDSVSFRCLINILNLNLQHWRLLHDPQENYGEVANWYLDSEMPESVRDMEVVETDPSAVGDVDILFSALPADVARKVEPEFAEKYIVASNASAMRMEPDVPLVIPEVNPEFLDLIEVQQRRRGWDGSSLPTPTAQQ